MTEIGLKNLKGFVSWEDEKDSPPRREENIRNWLLSRLPFEVTILKANATEHEIEEFIECMEGSWSAYNIGMSYEAHFFFELDSDAVAFKLRWL